MKIMNIKLITIILILLLGCENQKSKENDIEIEKQNEIFERQTEIINKTSSKILQEQDSIPLSLIIFSLSTKEVEKMLQKTNFCPLIIFFHSKYKITSDTNSSFKLFSIDFKIIKIINKTNRFPLMKLDSYTQEGNDIYLRYYYGGVYVVTYLKKINNNYKIIECFEYET